MYTVRVEKRHTIGNWYGDCQDCALARLLNEAGFRRVFVGSDNVGINGRDYDIVNHWFKIGNGGWGSKTFENIQSGIIPYFDVIIDMPAPAPLRPDITKSLAVLPIEETSDLIIVLVSNI